MIYDLIIAAAHATTNSSHGVTSIGHIASVLDRMQSLGMPLLIHGEVTDSHVDIFDREARFIEQVLIPLRSQFPRPCGWCWNTLPPKMRLTMSVPR